MDHFDSEFVSNYSKKGLGQIILPESSTPTKVGNVNLKGVYSYTGQQIVPSIYLSIEYKLILSKDIFILFII